MANLQDVVEVAELLRVNAVEIVQDRCAAVRNRNSSCRKCVDACFAQAVAVKDNQVDIDDGACVNCGVCVSVCPTSALAAAAPSLHKLESDIAARRQTTGRAVCIACDRAAAHHDGNEEAFAAVPCLGQVTEQLLCDAAAGGAERIVLVDGDCATCKYGQASPFVDASVEGARALLSAVDADAAIERTTGFPDEFRAHAGKNLRGADRRGLIFQTGSYIKAVAGNVAQKAIEEKLAPQSAPKTLRDRLSAGKTGKMPPFSPDRNMQVLDDLSRLGEPRDGRIETRLFGEVAIDAEACSGCGLCVLFCPTRALTYAEYDEPDEPGMRYLEFRTADCVQCMLCRDVCMRKCLDVGAEVRATDLFEFEPKLMAIPRPGEKQSILDRFKAKTGR